MRYIFLLSLILVSSLSIHAQVNPDSSRIGRIPATPDTLVNDSSNNRIPRGNPDVILLDSPESQDSTESIVTKKKKKRDLSDHDPEKAYKRSLAIPGWGQIYNRSWWKVPIIYAGFGTIGYFIFDFNKQYRRIRNAYIAKLDGETEFDGIDLVATSDANLISVRDFNRRYRDLNIIFGVLWYGLNVVDAFVEGHLKGFDVSDDLSLHFRPGLQSDPLNNKVYLGATIKLKLKR